MTTYQLVLSCNINMHEHHVIWVLLLKVLQYLLPQLLVDVQHAHLHFQVNDSL